MAKISDPLNDYQLLEVSGSGSLFFANIDTIGVESTPTLDNTFKPLIVNEETDEPGVITGEPLNEVPRGDLDKGVYDNTSDVYYNPEYTYEIEKEEVNEEEGKDNEEEITNP